jgi:hypothetical protein
MKLPQRTNPARHGAEDHSRESEAPGEGRRAPSLSRHPATRRELLTDGYDFLTMKVCPCGRRMELWDGPNGDTLAFNLMPTQDSRPQIHFLTCGLAVQFRRAIPSDANATAPAPGTAPLRAPAEPPAVDPKLSPKSATQPEPRE